MEFWTATALTLCLSLAVGIKLDVPEVVDRKRMILNAIETNRSGSCPASPHFLYLGSMDPSIHWNLRYAEQVRAAATYVQLVRAFLSNARLDIPNEGIYSPILRSLLDNHPGSTLGCALYLNYDAPTSSPSSSSSSLASFLLYVYRNLTDRHRPVGVRNWSKRMNDPTSDNNNNNQSAFEEIGGAATEAPTIGGFGDEEVLVSIVNDFRKQFRNESKMQQNSSRSWQATGSWSTPWLDCARKSWCITYSMPIYNESQWRGLILMTIDLSSFDIDQCAQQNDHLFGGTHLCHPDTMQCIHVAGKGFRAGSYTCSCRQGYFYPNASALLPVLRQWEGDILESELGDGQQTRVQSEEDFRCLPCPSGCFNCTDFAPCFVDYDILWRGVPLGLQSFCMTITVVLAIAVFQLRKCKVIASGMWTVLEMILVGALLLYSTVVIRYFEPSTLSCLLEPWFREMGFAICYGTIILKMYRILVEFRTRKAHRWVIRDKDLLKYLAGIILVVLGYMSAWTAISIDHIREGDSIVDRGVTNDQRLNYYICKSRWWEYVTEAGEMTFLVFGIYISYHIRNASGPYNEKRYLCLAIYIEALISLLLYVFRHHVWLTFHPDYIFLMYFARCQLTVSITLFLIFGPKVWYYYRPLHDGAEGEHGRGGEGQDHVAPEVLKLQDGITSNGELDIGEINLADMDPEDIRAELRRVYTQLQVLRNKTMRKDNPHISKRRGGRKATHRRFSLQAFHRHRHHHEQEHETDVSKTPEESTGSADAGASPAVASDPSCESAVAPNVALSKVTMRPVQT